ncbi:unnamed protein product [Phytophthora fragariaefolia]|uniref:Unnamed protein product n=1 Tax=Phytophthora fragariaefolia TaxID=1490495 RepID=A0A9W6YMR9_9STRA|nr:unnamed protein product [Phytophthora fragariaefolia]
MSVWLMHASDSRAADNYLFFVEVANRYLLDFRNPCAAVVVAEDGVGAGLHGEAVVLVVDRVARDRDVVVLGQVEAVRVLGDAVARARVERETADGRILACDEAEGAEGRVLEREA